MNKYKKTEEAGKDFLSLSTKELVKLVSKDSGGFERTDLKDIIYELGARCEDLQRVVDKF